MDKPLAGYYRVSKARDEMKAPELYQEAIEDYCRYKRADLAETFSDIDYSGRKGSKPRPGMEELKARRGEFSAVVTPKLSRFGRSLKDLIATFELFDDDGIGLVFLDLDIDTRTSTGRLVRNIMASLAEWEGDRLSEGWQAVHAHNARLGRPHGGPVPYGYRRGDDGNYEVVPERARLVREIFDRFISGDTGNAIAEDFNRRGVGTATGAWWWGETIHEMVCNPAFAGLRRFSNRNGTELTKATWAPIIERETWEQATALREQRRQQAVALGPRHGNGAYMLSGLIACGACGRNLHHAPAKKAGNRKGGISALYVCPRGTVVGRTFPESCRGGAIVAHRAESMVAREFLDRVSSPYAKRALRAPRSLFPKGDEDSRRLEKIDARMSRLVDQLADAGPGQAQAVKKKMGALESERADIAAKVERAKLDHIATSRRLQDLRQLREVVSNLEVIWEAANVEERRNMLRIAIDKVVLVPRTDSRARRQVQVRWAEWLRG